jgi:hypothetical protein
VIHKTRTLNLLAWVCGGQELEDMLKCELQGEDV